MCTVGHPIRSPVKVLPFCQEWLPSDQSMLNKGLKLLFSVSVKTYLNQSSHLMVHGLPAISSWRNHHNVTNLHNNFNSERWIKIDCYAKTEFILLLLRQQINLNIVQIIKSGQSNGHSLCKCGISPRALCHLYGKAGNNCKRISDSGIHIYEPSLVTY